ncbi:hypothetical protein OF001_U40198 [Pseudomonas sp. OF001]|nr:hypothetical protein OF001_U40198 [Pseudomonas sp. OF001]
MQNTDGIFIVPIVVVIDKSELVAFGQLAAVFNVVPGPSNIDYKVYWGNRFADIWI